MVQIVGHRWERQFERRGYKCVKLPLGSVESGQWCIGCGCFIGDIDICNGKYGEAFDGKEVWLDQIASERGLEPIQSGTLAEAKYLIGKGGDARESASNRL